MPLDEYHTPTPHQSNLYQPKHSLYDTLKDIKRVSSDLIDEQIETELIVERGRRAIVSAEVEEATIASKMKSTAFKGVEADYQRKQRVLTIKERIQNRDLYSQEQKQFDANWVWNPIDSPPLFSQWLIDNNLGA